MNEPARFGIVGGGWRAEFFLRIAAALPERFQVTGVVTRDATKGRALEARWDIPTYRNVAELRRAATPDPEFVVVSVLREVAPGFIRELAEAGIAVLAETPAAADVAGLEELYPLVRDGARIEVAEQYPLQPLLRAQLEIAASGRLGRVTHASISVAHDYHGISLLRRFLGIGFEDATITAHAFAAPLVDGPTRFGPPAQDAVSDTVQTIAYLDFGDRTGVFDFTKGQYFSWVRSNGVLVRGPRGEIRDDRVRYLRDHLTPVTWTITRVTLGENGNQEGHVLRGLIAGDEWLYRNPFEPARLADDELAIAELLIRMRDHARGGPSAYSLAEAAQDHYLQLAVHEAARTGVPVQTTTQVWAS